MGRQIELAQKGERFRIIESAQPPTVPVSPNRPLWFVAGTLLGVMSGLGLLALREISDTTFHRASDLQDTFALPVLASVPRVDVGTGRRRWPLGSRSRAFGVSADV
jgi:capsular polysaccharide biosynthesis protein